jgi:hypothetical protein
MLWLGHPAETFVWVNKVRNVPEPGQLVQDCFGRLHRVTAVDGDGDTLYFEDGRTASWSHCCEWPGEPGTWWGALPAFGRALYVLLAAAAVTCLILGILTA